MDWLESVENNAEETGLDWEETEVKRAAELAAETKKAEEAAAFQPASVEGKLIRFDGPMKPAGASGESGTGGKGKEPIAGPTYDEDEDPASTRKLDVESIVLKDGLGVYKDQAGRLWTGLATYWIKRGEFDRVRLGVHKRVALFIC